MRERIGYALSMRSCIEIRPARKEDLVDIALLQYETFSTAYVGTAKNDFGGRISQIEMDIHASSRLLDFDEDGWLAYWNAGIMSTITRGQRRLWVAEDTSIKQVVGVSDIMPDDETASDSSITSWYLGGMHVNSNYRGEGVGSVLLDKPLRYVGDNSRVRARLTEGSEAERRGFYDHRGFIRTENLVKHPELFYGEYILVQIGIERPPVSMDVSIQAA